MPGSGADAVVEPPGQTSAQRSQQRVDVERAVAGISHCPCSSRRPTTVGRGRPVVQGVLHHHSSVGFFSSTTSTSSSPRRTTAPGRVERHGHEQLEQADAVGPQVVVAARGRAPQRLAQLVVRVPAGGDADPVVGGPDLTRLSRLSTP
jgi:hypothetical protein